MSPGTLRESRLYEPQQRAFDVKPPWSRDPSPGTRISSFAERPGDPLLIFGVIGARMRNRIAYA
jgi:hypothetical protein